MSQTTAQIVLALIFLSAAIIFVILDEPNLAIALVGAVLGQGASAGVRAASNGK